MQIEEAINIIELTTKLTKATFKMDDRLDEIALSPYVEALEIVVNYAKKQYTLEKVKSALKQ